MNRIPLAQRLDENNAGGAMVQLAQVNLCEFFSSLACAYNDTYYSDVYYGCILEPLTQKSAAPVETELDFDFFDGVCVNSDIEFTTDSSFAEAVAAAMNLPREERARLLHHIIIEPFIKR